MKLSVRGVLLDIEGTTSSIDFVYQEMFPYVRRELEAFLKQHWTSEEVVAACRQIALESGPAFPSVPSFGDAHQQQAAIAAEVLRLMDGDAKTTGLKQLQGLIWHNGFASGELRAHVFPDVAPTLKEWQDYGIETRIYSSGSVAAQKLFFGHSIEGDLLPLISGHYDTTCGPKRESASYKTIAEDWQLPPHEILFVSDVLEEIAAAGVAGMQNCLCERPGNATVTNPGEHKVIRSLQELDLRLIPVEQ